MDFSNYKNNHILWSTKKVIHMCVKFVFLFSIVPIELRKKVKHKMVKKVRTEIHMNLDIFKHKNFKTKYTDLFYTIK